VLSRKSVWRAAQHCKQVSHSAEESLIKIQHIHRFLKQDTRKSRCSEICAFKEICLACCTTLQAGISLRRRIFNKNPTHSSLQTAPASKASKQVSHTREWYFARACILLCHGATNAYHGTACAYCTRTASGATQTWAPQTTMLRARVSSCRAIRDRRMRQSARK